MKSLEELAAEVRPLDRAAMELARARQDELVKPRGSLGELEELSIRMAGITGKVKNTIGKRRLLLFAADNGVYEEGISAAPQSFTALLAGLYGADKDCAINVLCRRYGVELRVVDMGVAGETPGGGVLREHLMDGTRNFCKECAMPPEVARRAVETGFRYAVEARADGCDILAGGEVGMGNTTTAAAVILAAMNSEDTDAFTGRGAGLSDEAFAHKKEVIARGLQKRRPLGDGALEILSKVGGLDIAALTGLYLGAAHCGLPVVLDGVISMAAALLTVKLCPAAREYMLASHTSEEPAYRLAAQSLGVTPILTLGMRLGEGTGCPIAMGILDSALAVMNEMSTFAEASLDSL